MQIFGLILMSFLSVAVSAQLSHEGLSVSNSEAEVCGVNVGAFSTCLDIEVVTMSGKHIACVPTKAEAVKLVSQLKEQNICHNSSISSAEAEVCGVDIGFSTCLNIGVITESGKHIACVATKADAAKLVDQLKEMNICL
jgi:hypothetical protein